MTRQHGGAAATMRAAAATLLAALDDAQRAAATRAFDAAADRRRLEYRPRPRPGVHLADLGVAARTAVHRLLATGLSPASFAQAVAITALEEVLDAREGGRRGRHGGDYAVLVFGAPGDERWGWRVEGHHLSVTMTVVGGVVSPAPVFLGANPARVDLLGRPVLRPLGVEEDLGRELLLALPPAARRRAVVAGTAPADLRSGPRPEAARLEPAGVPRADLPAAARAMLDRLVAAYLGRLPGELAAALAPDPAGLHFAWEGPPGPGVPHYYRVQADDLLLEYDNTAADGNHAHTVLRRPRGDFGGDLLAAHHAGG